MGEWYFIIKNTEYGSPPCGLASGAKWRRTTASSGSGSWTKTLTPPPSTMPSRTSGAARGKRPRSSARAPRSKEEQINLMKEAYEHAASVLVWLGKDDTGLDGIETPINAAHKIIPEAVDDPARNRESAATVAPNLKTALELDLAPLWSLLLCHNWLERKWVFQEAIRDLTPEWLSSLWKAMTGERARLSDRIDFDWSDLFKPWSPGLTRGSTRGPRRGRESAVERRGRKPDDRGESQRICEYAQALLHCRGQTLHVTERGKGRRRDLRPARVPSSPCHWTQEAWHVRADRTGVRQWYHGWRGSLWPVRPSGHHVGMM